MLTEIAKTQPQAMYSSFVHGVFRRWTYFFRTCALEESQLSSLEDSLRNYFIPTLTDRDSINDLEHDWLSLQSGYGGLGLVCPRFAHIQFSASVNITSHWLKSY